MAKYEERTYREWVNNDDLVTIRVAEDETDLLISGSIDLTHQAKKSVSFYRKQLKDYISRNRRFLVALEPIEILQDAPEIIESHKINRRAKPLPVEETVIDRLKNGIDDKEQEQDQCRQQEEENRQVILKAARGTCPMLCFQHIRVGRKRLHVSSLFQVCLQ